MIKAALKDKLFEAIRIRWALRLTRSLMLSSALCLSTASVTGAYETPPPLKTITSEERTRLDSAKTQREFLRIATILMEEKLRSAESAAMRRDEFGIFRELGSFHGLLDLTIDTLTKTADGARPASGSQLGNLKRFEMTLRSYPPRIELIRRASFEFDDYILDLQRVIREARARAIDPMFRRIASEE